MITRSATEFRPDYVAPPGATLKETIDALGMKQTELALRTGRHLKVINEIIQGKSQITPATALQLEKVLNISAAFWLGLEQAYREHLERQKEIRLLDKSRVWLKQVPVREMILLGWIRDCGKDQVTQLREVLTYFGVASVDEFNELALSIFPARFRQSRVYKANPVSVAAWLRHGLLQAQKMRVDDYNATKFSGALREIRSLTRSAEFQNELVRLCAETGVAVVFTPEITKTHLNGATRWLGARKAMIQLSLRGKRNDIFWFSFFHEACHILHHKKSEMFVEYDSHEDEIEMEADQWAQDFLIPAADFRRLTASQAPSQHFSKFSVQQFAKQIDVAPGIVVGRLQHEGILPKTYLKELFQALRWS
jgi:addiction module HigA family antidote